MRTDSLEISKTITTKEIEVKFKVKDTTQNMESLLKMMKVIENGKDLKIEIKQYREKRSLDANGYCWVLADKIAKVIGNTKEYVYKKAIKSVGDFEVTPIKDEAVKKWISNWESKGIGWQSEVLSESKLKGYTNIINYYGSSVYDSKDMAVLIDELIYEAKLLDIDTITPAEKEKMLKFWDIKEE